MLAEELPDSTFVEAHGILEWRVRPARLNALTTDFVTRCFESDPVSAGLSTPRPANP
jgi:hypothetical protein